jgi:hypothetical protein
VLSIYSVSDPDSLKPDPDSDQGFFSVRIQIVDLYKPRKVREMESQDLGTAGGLSSLEDLISALEVRLVPNGKEDQQQDQVPGRPPDESEERKEGDREKLERKQIKKERDREKREREKGRVKSEPPSSVQVAGTGPSGSSKKKKRVKVVSSKPRIQKQKSGRHRFVRPWPENWPLVSSSNVFELWFEGFCGKCGHSSHPTGQCRIYTERFDARAWCTVCRQGVHRVCKSKRPCRLNEVVSRLDEIKDLLVELSLRLDKTHPAAQGYMGPLYVLPPPPLAPALADAKASELAPTLANATAVGLAPALAELAPTLADAKASELAPTLADDTAPALAHAQAVTQTAPDSTLK